MNVSPFQVSITDQDHLIPGAPLLLSLVPAGFPSPAEDYIENSLNLHQFVVKNPPATYFVWAVGDSMYESGVFDGDLMVVDRSVDPTDGKVVVCSVGGELTVKYYRRKGKRIWLQPANPAYEPIEITGKEDTFIWGVVTYVLHKPQAPGLLPQGSPTLPGKG